VRQSGGHADLSRTRKGCAGQVPISPSAWGGENLEASELRRASPATFFPPRRGEISSPVTERICRRRPKRSDPSGTTADRKPGTRCGAPARLSGTPAIRLLPLGREPATAGQGTDGHAYCRVQQGPTPLLRVLSLRSCQVHAFPPLRALTRLAIRAYSGQLNAAFEHHASGA
jgi:hypothetical protein